MGFFVTTLIFLVIGIIASLSTRICCNRGPSTNLFHLTLVITAAVCCWMIMLRAVRFARGYMEQLLNIILDCHKECILSPRTILRWAIVYLAQMNPLIVPILNEGE